MKRIIFLCVILANFSFHLRGQPTTEVKRLSVMVGVGFLPSFVNLPYAFRNHLFSSQPKTSFYGTAGISYPAFQFDGGTSVVFSAEALYGKVSTPVTDRGWFTDQMKMEKLFLGFWTTLVIPATISPFVRVGVGIANVHLQEFYTVYSDNVDERTSKFAIGAGGGIDWTLSKSLTLSFFGDGITTTKPPISSFMVIGIRSYWQL